MKSSLAISASLPTPGFCNEAVTIRYPFVTRRGFGRA